MFEIETDEAIYELEFIHAQINVTSKCNMRCDHCRGDYCGSTEISLNDFENLVVFSQQNLGENGGYLISGGEPLMYSKFRNLLRILKKHTQGNEFVSLTTNGYFLTDEILDFMESLEFGDLRVSVSLDSADASKHNAFRHCEDAYERAIKAITLTSKRKNIKSIVRATITKEQLEEVPRMADLVNSLGADILSFSSVIPVGRALGNTSLYFDSNSKKKLIDLAVSLNSEERHLVIDVNDPLSYVAEACSGNSGDYGGCIAGIGGFSVEPDGSMLPCPVLPNQMITNIIGKTPTEILEAYQSSPFVHALIDRKLSGKCGQCDLRFMCGGCRARAEGMTGDYLGEDTDCWI